MAACSNTGGTEPLPPASNEVAKPGREQRITKPKRVWAPPGITFVGEPTLYGFASKHGYGTKDGRPGYEIICEPGPAVCYTVGGGGTWIDINERGITTGSPEDPTTATSAFLHLQDQ